MGREIQLLSDRALADRARTGDPAAFGEVFRRHSVEAWRLAMAVTADETAAAESVVAGFARTFALTPVTPPTTPPRAQLLETVRHAALARPHADPDTTVPVVAAFQRLPELWRSALWLTTIDGVPSSEAIAILGVDRSELSPLAQRARAGLIESAMSARSAAAGSRDCRRTTEALPAYAADRTSPRETVRIRRHLDGCARCRSHLVELDDLLPLLSAAIPALPATLDPEAVAAWRGLMVRPRGPMHMALPGGVTVPAWAERAVAGAAAAVVTLGIFSATLLAGRGGRVDDPSGRREVASAPGLADGESAAADTGTRVPPTLDGDSGLPPLVPPTPTPPPTPPTGDSGPASASQPGDSSPAGGSEPVPSSVPPAPAPAAPPPPPASTPTTAPDPALEVAVSVGDVLAVQVGDACTGVEILGTTVGCVDATSNGGTLSVGTGGSLLPPIELGL